MNFTMDEIKYEPVKKRAVRLAQERLDTIEDIKASFYVDAATDTDAFLSEYGEELMDCHDIIADAKTGYWGVQTIEKMWNLMVAEDEIIESNYR